MASSGGVPAERQLPKKENDLFRSVAKFYEQKQYKRGIKAADQVLQKFPNHGETQAMKGLVLNCLDRKEEAYALVKQAVRNDMRSHVCWHVFGLLYRSDHKYPDAVKCFKQALRIDKNNMQILRDMSFLQIQMRDLVGFAETRRQILCQKPNSKLNWMAFALANHMKGSVDRAIQVIDSYSETEGPNRRKDFEESELMLYRNQLLEEKGDWEGALAHLDECRDMVVDVLGWLQKRAELLLLLGRFEEARSAWRGLITEYGAENYTMHRGWQCALLEVGGAPARRLLALKACSLPSEQLDLSDEQRACLREAYAGLAADLPRARAPRRIPLTFLQGGELEAELRRFIEHCLHKGVPALAADLSGLYTVREAGGAGDGQRDGQADGAGDVRRAKDPYDVARNPTFLLVQRLCDETLAALRATERFPGRGDDEPKEPPTSLLWCLFLKAQLEEARGQLDAALALVDECISHTPTAVDMYERRARILRKVGDVQGAADQMDAARRLDLADRYINNKTTKYLLRAGRLEQAMATIALFTRHEGNPEYNLLEMQVMWAEVEFGDAACSQGKHGLALKKYFAVEKHFTDFFDDLFDFHSYCLRKMTLRAYASVLHMTDDLKVHKYFQRAAQGAVRCYLALHDQPPAPAQEAEPDFSNMSAAQRKKEKAKARKAAKKAADEKAASAATAPPTDANTTKAAAVSAAEDGEDEEKKQDAADGGGKNKRRYPERPVPVDEDPLGEKLVAKDALEEARRFAAALTRFAPDSADNQALAFDTAVRRRKPLLALKAIVRGRRAEPDHPALILRLVQLATAANAASSDRDPPASSGDGPAAASTTPGPAPSSAATSSADPVELCRGAYAALSAAASEAFAQELATQLEQRPLAAFVESYAARPSTRTSLARAMAAARALLVVGAPPLEAVRLVTDGGLERRDVKVTLCEEAWSFLKDQAKDAGAATAWFDLCAARFSKSPVFGTTATVIAAPGGVENGAA